MNIPEEAIAAQVNANVYLSFIVDSYGYVKEEKITKGIGYGCNEEALRIVRSFPKWNPGSTNSKYVSVSYNLPIVLSGSKNKGPCTQGPLPSSLQAH